MVICPQCNIQHDLGEEFCKKCGKFLLVIEDEPLIENEEIETKLICPKCKKIYKKSTYCWKCGSILTKRSTSPEIDLPPFQIESIKEWARQWQRLTKEKKEIEICLNHLEAHRERFSQDTLNSVSNRYKSRLEALTLLFQTIENEVRSLKKRIPDEIDLLQNGLLPLHKRLEELNLLYKSGAIIKSDFVRETEELKTEIKLRQKRLKEDQQILSLLPCKRQGGFVFPNLTWNFRRPLPLLIACITFALIGGGFYFFCSKHHSPNKSISREIAISSSPSPSASHSLASKEDQEFEKIKSVFENIRIANLQKKHSSLHVLFLFRFQRPRRKATGYTQDVGKLQLSPSLL